MSEFRGDFLGFSYNGIHSSNLGIVRVSDGNRLNESLFPTTQDKTVQVPGGDGAYYFGSFYTQKQITVSFAFDSLTELQLQQIRKLFGDKKIHDLIFDETPYKAYQAKVTGSSTIKYIPFDDEAKAERIYKGEGNIQFTCYQPYAICRNKYLEDYMDWSNRSEWAAASGLKAARGDYDQLKNGVIKVYNPGVKEADWVLRLNNPGICTGYQISLDGNRGIFLSWEGEDDLPEYLTIDSKSNLIESGNGFYNEYIVEGDFFKIPVGESQIEIKKIGGATVGNNEASITYNLYYF